MSILSDSWDEKSSPILAAVPQDHEICVGADPTVARQSRPPRTQVDVGIERKVRLRVIADVWSSEETLLSPLQTVPSVSMKLGFRNIFRKRIESCYLDSTSNACPIDRRKAAWRKSINVYCQPSSENCTLSRSRDARELLSLWADNPELGLDILLVGFVR
jgi:hypothetical protein